MENNFNTLFKETKNHLPSKKYLYKPPKRKHGEIEKDRQGNTLYNDATPHKIVILSLAFNIALENYQNIRSNKQVKELNSLTGVSDMLLRYFSNKYYKNIDAIKIENKLINIQQNYEFEEIEKFKQIEYKLYGTIERLRNYHSHYIHEPGVLTFEDLFKSDGTLTTEDFNEAKEWFHKRFNDTHNHLTQSLKNRKEKLENEETNLDKTKSKQIDKVLKSFQYIMFLNEDEKTLSLEGQLFIACMFLYKRQAKAILDKWRNVKEPEGYENTKQTFFTYYCLSEKYSINNFNDNLLKFRDITSKLSTIPYNKNSNLEFVYEKIRDINNQTYDAIEKLEKKDDPQNKKATPKEYSTNNKIAELLKVKKDQRDTLIDILKTVQKGKFKKALENINLEIEELESKNNESTNILSPLEKIKSKIMPIRKRYIFTKVLLQYIIDNELIALDNFKIAIKKTNTDVLEYYEEHKAILDKNKNLTFLKNKIKELEKGSAERIILNEHLKELKRNFVFKTPTELKKLTEPIEIYDNEKNYVRHEVKGYDFSLKKKNALIQYQYGAGKNDVANINLSSQLLLKWVFIHLTTGENKGFSIIKNFIKDHIERLTKKGITSEVLVSSFYKNPQNKRLIGKVFPTSITNNSNEKGVVPIEKIKRHIGNRIESLKKFYHTNTLQAKPWTYESKSKIDTVLNYMHFCLLNDVYKNEIHTSSDYKTQEDFIRHNYFNMTTHNIASEYFRYFGRYQNNNLNAKEHEYSLQVINTLKTEYKICFGYVERQIEYSKSLEELFNSVIKNYIEKLESIQNSLQSYTTLQLIPILKINTRSNTDNVNKMLSDHFYVKSFALSPEIISIKEVCKEEWDNFKRKKEKSLNGKPFNCSDFAFIRNHLEGIDNVKTNIDYMLTHIVPLTKVKRIPNTAFKQLLKLKTEELILWNIAKSYWKKASDGKAYKFSASEKNISNPNYQLFCTFNKVYNRVLDYEIVIDKNFWFTKKGNPTSEQKRFNLIIQEKPEVLDTKLVFTVRVPARKYDNKFLSVETKLIKEYCLWNHFNFESNTIELPKEYEYINNNKVKTIYNLQEYEDLMKIIYKELKKSVNDIGLILSSEKKIIDAKQADFMDVISEKYKNESEIKDFYLALTNDKCKYDIALFNEFLNKIDNNTFTKTQIEEYLVSFRNFALHYQLQDPKRREIISLFLSKYNNYKKASKNDYSHKE